MSSWAVPQLTASELRDRYLLCVTSNASAAAFSLGGVAQRPCLQFKEAEYVPPSCMPLLAEGTRAWLRHVPFGLYAELGAVPLGGHRRLMVQLPPPGPAGGSYCSVAPRNPDVRLLPPTRGKLSPDGTILEILVRPSAYRTVRWSCSVMLPQLSPTAYSLTVTAHCKPGITRAKARLEDRLCRLEAAWCELKKQKQTADRMRSLGRLRPKTAGDVSESQRQQELLEELWQEAQVQAEAQEDRREPAVGSEQLLGPLGLTPDQEDALQKAETRAAWEEARQLWRRERAAAVSHRPRTAPTAQELDTQECLALADRAEEWVRLQERLSGPPPGEEGPVAERRRVVYEAPPAEADEEQEEPRESPREEGAGEPAPSEAQTAPVSADVSELGTEVGAGDAASISSSSSSEVEEGSLDPEWMWRRRALERFQWAARRVVLRGRLLRQLSLLSALLAAYKDRRRILAVGPREEPPALLEAGAEGDGPEVGGSSRHVQVTEQRASQDEQH